jgi:hypothetical protein
MGVIAAAVVVGLIVILKILPALVAGLGIALFLVILFIPYWTPTIIAFVRKHPSRGGEDFKHLTTMRDRIGEERFVRGVALYTGRRAPAIRRAPGGVADEHAVVVGSVLTEHPSARPGSEPRSTRWGSRSPARR